MKLITAELPSHDFRVKDPWVGLTPSGKRRHKKFLQFYQQLLSQIKYYR